MLLNYPLAHEVHSIVESDSTNAMRWMFEGSGFSCIEASVKALGSLKFCRVNREGRVP